ncbi:hypothetical protein HN865_00180 [Candidatus Woesearchaeota archaeon]|jgi:hypothetical protein|nr:hypothetical protein [Candidatus Woesearchaeota archaeon]MBT7237258.1 hypothetical protein [Candidatus Woesearchaeota archaeon]
MLTAIVYGSGFIDKLDCLNHYEFKCDIFEENGKKRKLVSRSIGTNSLEELAILYAGLRRDLNEVKTLTSIKKVKDTEHLSETRYPLSTEELSRFYERYIKEINNKEIS